MAAGLIFGSNYEGPFNGRLREDRGARGSLHDDQGVSDGFSLLPSSYCIV